MKVCSLIDKRPDAEDSSPSISMANKVQNCQTQSENSRLPSIEHSHFRLKELKTPTESNQHFNPLYEKTQQNLDAVSSSRVSDETPSTESRFVPESVAVSLLGPGVKGFAMTSSMFEEAVRLRAEQEKTEQERLKLDLVAKTKSILEFAVDNNIPPETLAFLRREEVPDRANLAIPQSQPSGQYISSGESQTGAPPDTMNAPFQGSPYLAASPSQPPRHYENTNNASSVDPMNFRFGGIPKFNQSSPQNIPNRRPRSPAKLGALAVANLANPITPYRPTNRTIPLHQRHYSMPAESMTSGNKSAERHYSRTRNPYGSQATNSLKSPLRGTSSMQVRPLPAQPLHKQTRSGHNISQESMTQRQQVIQFHHWISENPGEKPTEKLEHRRNNSISSSSSVPTSHKRHKSTDRTIDLSQVESMSDLHQRSNNRFVTETRNA
ncbi:hypothetical protein JCM33374_g5404 [Metschnikowia sp. JCM 33374]|nr:hypothetical protein JCM33374_g5404 [Metschnikowia sp. JCM 33374]